MNVFRYAIANPNQKRILFETQNKIKQEAAVLKIWD